MSSKGDCAYPELLVRIRQLEDETARLQLLIAELVLKNQHLRRDLRAPGVWGRTWSETEDNVVDRTGIKGVFGITLKGAATEMLQPDGPSLFTLVQLGLKLVSAKAPIEVLVVDHAENPSLN